MTQNILSLHHTSLEYELNCRHCSAPLEHTFLDLGSAPPSNAYLTKEALSKPEIYYPLKVRVCDQCWLVQTEDYTQPTDLFGDNYAYFSSTSSSWNAHALRYFNLVKSRFNLTPKSLVVEVASNDGYLLRHFVKHTIPCLGIEPSGATADAAELHGIPVLREYFTEELATRLAKEGKQADLIVGNNVFAHVPNINDFTRGLKELLKPEGTITLEFPHLMRLINHRQFDTVYHEHFSYLSLISAIQIFKQAGLRIWDVDQLDTHGGSLRIYGCHENDARVTRDSVTSLLNLEEFNGLKKLSIYTGFQAVAEKVKNDILLFLLDNKRNSRKVAAYGAAAKGNTLLNYAGIKPDLLSYVCDAAPSKQNKYMPGSHIPILSPEQLKADPPDVLLILPWNIADEVKIKLATYVKTAIKLYIGVPNLTEI